MTAASAPAFKTQLDARALGLDASPPRRRRTTAAPGGSFSPTDLVGAALASCALTTMALAASREGIPLGEATATVEKRMTPPPRRIGELVLEIHDARGPDPRAPRAAGGGGPRLPGGAQPPPGREAARALPLPGRAPRRLTPRARSALPPLSRAGGAPACLAGLQALKRSLVRSAHVMPTLAGDRSRGRQAMDVKLLGIYLNDHLAGSRWGWTWPASGAGEPRQSTG